MVKLLYYVLNNLLIIKLSNNETTHIKLTHSAVPLKSYFWRPYEPEACSTMRALGVLSSVFPLLDRCLARNSKMATKTIMGFCERICTQYFQTRFLE